MNERAVSFAGRSVALSWDDPAAAGFLDLLCTDLGRAQSRNRRCAPVAPGR